MTKTQGSSNATWFVYIVRCADGALYTGISTDVSRRVAEHNAGTGAKYIRYRRPVHLVYVKRCLNRVDASRVEYDMKKLTKDKKEALVLAFGSLPRPWQKAV